MASATGRQLLNPQTLAASQKMLISAQQPIFNSLSFTCKFNCLKFDGSSSSSFSSHQNLSVVVVKSSAGKEGSVTSDDEEGISLGTMKLPLDTNIPRFEILLFQWANSLNQGAQLPLPVPLKVDKIEGGVRLGFVEIEDGKTQVGVYIDCQVFDSDPPMFRASRKGALKNKVPPGEPRIMKSLLAALQKSVEIAK